MTRKIILAVLALCVVAVAGLQLFLAYGLTDSLRKWVIPSLKSKYNADVSVARISVNLLGGSLGVHGIKVANPPGFDEPLMLSAGECRLKVGLPALLKSRSADIRHAALKNVIFTVARGRNGSLNIEPVLSAMQTMKDSSPARVGAPSGGGPGGGAREVLPNVIIKKMEMESRLDYLDWQAGQPFRLSIELNLLLNNIANFGLDDSLSGTINLHGNILEGGRKCAFDLNGRIAPVSDPLQASFELAGSMQTIELKVFKGLIEKVGLEDGKASGTITLACRNGRFDPEKSMLRLKLSDLVPTKEKAERMGNIPMPSILNLVVPIDGSIANPKVDFPAAFLKSITSEDAVNSILQNIIDKKGKKADGAASDSRESTGADAKKSGARGLLDEILGGAGK